MLTKYLPRYETKYVCPFLAEVSESLRILYGGSVTGGNCRELGACEDLDGFLFDGRTCTKLQNNAIFDAKLDS